MTGSMRMVVLENGDRDREAERELHELRERKARLEQAELALATRQQMLADVVYEPPDDADALEQYRRAQRQAAAMSSEVLQELRNLMLTSKRETVKLDAAKALWEIASRIGGGSGKAGSVPGTNVLVIDREDFNTELAKRRKAGKV